jgi:hypothetical protein
MLHVQLGFGWPTGLQKSLQRNFRIGADINTPEAKIAKPAQFREASLGLHVSALIFASPLSEASVLLLCYHIEFLEIRALNARSFCPHNLGSALI